MEKSIFKILLPILLLVIVVMAPSCMTTRTSVGSFTETQGEMYKYAKGKQCYLFWGLIPLGRTTVATPAGQPCQVRTSFNFWDALLSTITGGIFSMQTIKVYAKRPISNSTSSNEILPDPVPVVGTQAPTGQE